MHSAFIKAFFKRCPYPFIFYLQFFRRYCKLTLRDWAVDLQDPLGSNVIKDVRMRVKKEAPKPVGRHEIQLMI